MKLIFENVVKSIQQDRQILQQTVVEKTENKLLGQWNISLLSVHKNPIQNRLKLQMPCKWNNQQSFKSTLFTHDLYTQWIHKELKKLNTKPQVHV